MAKVSKRAKIKRVVRKIKRKIGKIRKRAKKITKSVKKKMAKSTLNRIKKHYGFLEKLVAASNNLTELKKMFKYASKGEILVVAEIVLNLLRRNIPLTETQKRILCPFRNRLRQIASKKTNCEEKRELCTNQKGGFLGIIGTILSAAIPAIKGLISTFIPS